MSGPRICGVGGRCERHDIALHGYPCHACQLEWERRSPRVVALIRRQAGGRAPVVTSAQMTRARAQDAEAVASYDGPHDVTIKRAGRFGPVAKLWNAVCVEGCGWSHYWLKSRKAADAAAAEHVGSGA